MPASAENALGSSSTRCGEPVARALSASGQTFLRGFLQWGVHNSERSDRIEPVQVDYVGRHVDVIITDNPDKWEQAQLRPQLLGWFVGQAIKRLNGAVDPDVVYSRVCERLERSHDPAQSVPSQVAQQVSCPVLFSLHLVKPQLRMPNSNRHY